MSARKKSGSNWWLPTLFLILVVGVAAAQQSPSGNTSTGSSSSPAARAATSSALSAPSAIAAGDPAGAFYGLQVVTAKRAHRDDYKRASFGKAWTDNCTVDGCLNHCDTRSDILRRDLSAITLGSSGACPDNTPLQGTLNDPYTGARITFTRGADTSAAVQVDHIYPLAAAYDMGAWAWTDEQRINFAEDPMNLLAVSGPANQAKSDSLPGTTPDRQGHSWMPPNKAYHCAYAQKLIAVAGKYALPIDQASVPVLTAAMATCPAS